MNAVIAAVAGGVLGFVAMLGGVSALSNTSTQVSPDQLYTYADE